MFRIATTRLLDFSGDNSHLFSVGQRRLTDCRSRTSRMQMCVLNCIILRVASLLSTHTVQFIIIIFYRINVSCNALTSTATLRHILGWRNAPIKRAFTRCFVYNAVWSSLDMLTNLECKNTLLWSHPCLESLPIPVCGLYLYNLAKYLERTELTVKMAGLQCESKTNKARQYCP